MAVPINVPLITVPSRRQEDKPTPKKAPSPARKGGKRKKKSSAKLVPEVYNELKAETEERNERRQPGSAKVWQRLKTFKL